MLLAFVRIARPASYILLETAHEIGQGHSERTTDCLKFQEVKPLFRRLKPANVALGLAKPFC